MKRLLLLLVLVPSTAVADDLERTVATMARIGFANSPSLSPDGKQVAFLSNMSGSPQIWIVSADGGWPDQITALDDPVTSIDWSPDGQWIAFQFAPGGGLNSQISIVRPNGTGMRQLTEGGKVNNWLATWTPDGKSIAFSSNRRDGAAMDAYLIGAASGQSAPRFEKSRDWSGQRCQPRRQVRDRAARREPRRQRPLPCRAGRR